jgi:hypothetical protein
MVGEFNSEMARKIALSDQLERRIARDIARPRRAMAILVMFIALARMSSPLMRAPQRHWSITAISAEVLFGLAIVVSLFGLPNLRMERGYLFVATAFGLLAVGVLLTRF